MRRERKSTPAVWQRSLICTAKLLARLCMVVLAVLLLHQTAKADCDHVWSPEREEHPASCTQTGSWIHRCHKCGASKSVKTDALGHDWKETSRTDATCMAKGVSNQKCQRSGCNATRQVELAINPNNHSYSWQVTTPSNCGKAGWQKFMCACGSVKDQKEVPPSGNHVWSTTSTTNPTCSSLGVYHQKCSG